MSVSTSATPNLEALLIGVTIEGWRLSRLILRVTGKLDAGKATRYGSRLRFFQRRLEENHGSVGMTLVNVRTALHVAVTEHPELITLERDSVMTWRMAS
jgi:hypothetical protein